MTRGHRRPIHHAGVCRRNGQLDRFDRLRRYRMLAQQREQRFETGVKLARAGVRLERDIGQMKPLGVV